MKTSLQVPEMSCQHCIDAITREVLALGGVQKVAVVLENKTVAIEHDPDVPQQALITAINEAGFDEVTV